MKTIVVALALSIGLISCNGQEEKKESAQNQPPVIGEKQELEPRGSWTVNKEVDEYGNIVKYDSTYTYSYSTINGEEVKIEDVDSLIRSFKGYFQDKIPPAWKQDELNPFWDDSLIEEDFFNERFFEGRWRASFEQMNKRMKHMDSIHDMFFQDFYPGLIESRTPRTDSIK